MALKVPKENPQLSEPLEGEAAERLVEYFDDPVVPEGHSALMAAGDQAFGQYYKPEPVNSLFFS